MLFSFCLPTIFIVPVSRGVMVGSEQRADLDTTQLTVRLTKLIRATAGSDQRDSLDATEDTEYYR